MSFQILIRRFVGFFLLSYLIISSTAGAQSLGTTTQCYRPPEVGYQLKMDMQVNLEKLHELGLVPDILVFGLNSEAKTKFELNVFVTNRISQTRDLVFTQPMTRQEPVVNLAVDQIRSKAYSEVSVEVKITELEANIGPFTVNSAAENVVKLITYTIPTPDSGATLHDLINEKLLLDNGLNPEAIHLTDRSIEMANQPISVPEKEFDCKCATNKICEGMYAYKYMNQAPAGLSESKLTGFSGTVGALSFTSNYRDLMSNSEIYPTAFIVRSVGVDSVVISPKDSLVPEFSVSAEEVFSVWPSDQEGLKPVGTTALIPNLGYGLGRAMTENSSLVNITGSGGGSPIVNSLMKVSLVGYLPQKNEYSERSILVKLEQDYIRPESFNFNSNLEAPLYMVVAGDHYMFYDHAEVCGTLDGREYCVGDTLLSGTDEELEIFALNPKRATITPVEMWLETMPLQPGIKKGPSLLLKSAKREGDFYFLNAPQIKTQNGINFGVDERTSVYSFRISAGSILKRKSDDQEFRVLGASGETVVLINTETKDVVSVTMDTDDYYNENACFRGLCQGDQIANMKLAGITMSGNYLLDTVDSVNIEGRDRVIRRVFDRSFRFEESSDGGRICDRDSKICNRDTLLAAFNGELIEVDVAGQSLVTNEYLVTMADEDGRPIGFKTIGSGKAMQLVGNTSTCQDADSNCYNFKLGKNEEYEVKGVAKTFSGLAQIVSVNGEYHRIPGDLKFTNLSGSIKTYVNRDSVVNFPVQTSSDSENLYLVGMSFAPEVVPAVIGYEVPEDSALVFEVGDESFNFKETRASELFFRNDACSNVEGLCVGSDLGYGEDLVYISQISLTGSYAIAGLEGVELNLNQLSHQVYDSGQDVLFRISDSERARFVTKVGRASYLLPYSESQSVLVRETEESFYPFVIDNSEVTPAGECAHEYCEYWNNRDLGLKILSLNQDGVLVIEDSSEIFAVGPGLNAEPELCSESNSKTICNGQRVYRLTNDEESSFDGIVLGSYMNGSRTKYALVSQSGDTKGQVVLGALSEDMILPEGCSNSNVCAGDIIFSQGDVVVEYFGNYTKRDLEIFALKAPNDFEEFDGQFIGEGCVQDGINDLLCVGDEYRVHYTSKLGGISSSVLVGFKEKANGDQRMIFVPTTGESVGKLFEAYLDDEDVLLDRIPSHCQLNPELSCSETDQDVIGDNLYYNQFIVDPMSFYSESPYKLPESPF